MTAYMNRGGPDSTRFGRYGNIQPYDVANWGYIILYLIVILVSLVGNGLFLFTVKKNPALRRTQHFMLASLAARDLIVSILVVPFVIDSQVNPICTLKGFPCNVVPSGGYYLQMEITRFGIIL